MGAARRRSLRTNLAALPGAAAFLAAHLSEDELYEGTGGRGVRSLRARLLLVLALAAAAPARAAYDDLGTSARVSGMSNAFTAVADDAYSIYYNPAGLATLDRPE